MCMQLTQLERALSVAAIRRKTAQSAMAVQSAYSAAFDSLRKASAEIEELESEIAEHVSEHKCRTEDVPAGVAPSEAVKEKQPG
jgi:hypothetical protein